MTDVLRRHLTSQHDHGDRVHVGSRDAGYGVRHTRPGSHKRNANTLRGTRIGIGRMHSRLFVSNQNVLDSP